MGSFYKSKRGQNPNSHGETDTHIITHTDTFRQSDSLSICFLAFAGLSRSLASLRGDELYLGLSHSLEMMSSENLRVYRYSGVLILLSTLLSQPALCNNRTAESL